MHTPTHTCTSLCSARERERPLAINDFVDKPKSKLGVKLVCDVTSIAKYIISASQSSSQTRAYFMVKKMGDGDRKKKTNTARIIFLTFYSPFHNQTAGVIVEI